MKVSVKRSIRSASGGQGTVEFAMIATAFLLTLFGLMFLGSVVYCYNTLSAAAREAVRYAIVHPNDTSNTQKRAENYAPGLKLQDSQVNVTWPADPNLPKKIDAKVQITYPYTVKIPFLKTSMVTCGSGKATFCLTSTSQMLVSQ